MVSARFKEGPEVTFTGRAQDPIIYTDAAQFLYNDHQPYNPALM